MLQTLRSAMASPSAPRPLVNSHTKPRVLDLPRAFPSSIHHAATCRPNIHEIPKLDFHFGAFLSPTFIRSIFYFVTFFSRWILGARCRPCLRNVQGRRGRDCRFNHSIYDGHNGTARWCGRGGALSTWSTWAPSTTGRQRMRICQDLLRDLHHC